MSLYSPKVSVVMPVYNRVKYTGAAIKSILSQSFSDFEFIIVDDGSTDSTYTLLKSFNDKRIKLIRKTKNQGNYMARNEGMDIAVGRYICVMDSDDIALPDRIQKQFDFMETNCSYGICGGFAKVINGGGIMYVPVGYEKIKVWLMSNMTFNHPAIFIRSEFLKKYNLRYDHTLRFAADYDFVVRAAHLFPVTNLKEVLLEYRNHPEQITVTNRKEQIKVAGKVILDQLSYFKENYSEKEKKLHLALMNRFPIRDYADLDEQIKWANFLLKSNNLYKHYHPVHLANFLRTLLKSIKIHYEMSKNKKASEFLMDKR